jgi:hypothetical protein
VLAFPVSYELACSWGQGWGINGSVKIAYGSAFIMPPDYTYALHFNTPLDKQAADIKQKLKPALTRDTTAPECVVYKPLQPERLVKLADELATLAFVDLTSDTTLQGIDKAGILADLVTSNLAYGRNLPAARRGPFRVCGQTAELLRAAVCEGSC